MARSALVTGGGRGLGRLVSVGLLADGWAVTVTGRDAGSLAAVKGAVAVAGDTTDPEHVTAALADAVPDLLVLNAGSLTTGGALWETDPAAWWRDVEVNLRGPALWLHAALPQMVGRGSGRVLVVGSGLGHEPVSGASAYSVSKTAVERLVEGVALELAGTGVIVLTASPGLVRTDMTEGFPPGYLALHPELATATRRDPALFVDLVLRFGRGELDDLHGRFVHVTTDVDAARRTTPPAGTLRLVPYE